ncbi:unnamed protein product (macronuclear) [Paramecium tetraurelia]|uniref:BTB domain-containing protein n=1 Tax=Paramecium tetraurelia TaxID=5888 RepID=A0DCG4_PARTE|nr:uncharacterized protein GSPATT00015609001 [Paramecium tetraurelia]CAK80731.1 unnamed protein product [Paramecium tetraurelia]|eukprot:XP_001448128.1 hypothetical protein (macronuclear) [Paramecium tetraurelia strain d4-2]
MLVLKFNDINTNQVQQQQQQYQYFRIILSRYANQQFQIKKAYTKFSGRWSKGSDSERQIDYVQEDLDVNLVAKLVNAFNGIEIVINTPQELYEMYQILHFFQIQELQNQIEKFLIQDKSSILIGYQLSELFEIDSLSNFYFEYFKEYGFLGIFNKKLDKEKARKHIYKNKNRLVPLHYLYLQANLFKKLLVLHNHLAVINFDQSKFLDQFQIALLISEYCLTNGYDRIKLQEIFSDAVIKDQVTNEQKQIILIEFEKQYKQNQMRAVSSISQSEEDDLSDTTIEIKNNYSENMISQIPIIEPIEIYRGKELDPKLLIGLKNLQFHFKTKHTSFGFYISKKIELNTSIEDEQLQLVNLSTKVQLNTSLRVNWIKFEENGLNVNNRLIIVRQKGICRYEDDVNEPNGQIRLTGCRNFRIEEVEVWNTCIFAYS